MAPKDKKQTPPKKSTLNEVVSREYTIHLHKHVFGRTFKKRAPTAVKAIREFATKTMGTSDVRLDPSLNKAVWARGIKAVPHRIRVRLSRRRNDAEDAKEKLYTFVTFVPVTNFKGLQTTAVEE
ncbi:hypothetical protein PhCBS80983_g00296 [Powellomyces hirtus]|uniref:60S ribosomal protein L31 n=1 Tax=Powellomyces hirtus TaxID=109895 RepID=A0A507EGZ6_9FUNG|nr:ribosomal protein L31e-domain-containing protein [Powellomyces hirtus]TPX62546.1 hypothetical protein PhCBS80983_g00296 [Powellomyces hirtus]